MKRYIYEVNKQKINERAFMKFLKGPGELSRQFKIVCK